MTDSVSGCAKLTLEVLDALEDALLLDKATRKQFGHRLARLEKILDYEFPVMILHTDNYEEVTESFIRINSKGTRLKEAELAMARLAYHWPGSIVEKFDAALDEYEEQGYEFEARVLMRCYIAVGTGQSRFQYLTDFWKRNKQSDLEVIWTKTKKALDHTINFLRNNAGLESSKWLPSINALVPLVGYFAEKDAKDRLTDREMRGLLFWFFQATVQGRFTGSAETKLDQDLKAVGSAEPIDDLVANLRRDSSGFSITPEMLEGSYQRNPFLPLIFTICRQRGARDWFTGVVLSSTNVGPEHQMELHHIFPKAVLKAAPDAYDTHEIDDLANIAFLSQKANRSILKSPPIEYLPTIEPKRLQDQFVPMQETFWEISVYREFLRKRREDLAMAVNSFFEEVGCEYYSQ